MACNFFVSSIRNKIQIMIPKIINRKYHIEANLNFLLV